LWRELARDLAILAGFGARLLEAVRSCSRQPP
jgi:hypothetical protein